METVLLKPAYCRWEVGGGRRGQEEAGFCPAPHPDTRQLRAIHSDQLRTKRQASFRFLTPLLGCRQLSNTPLHSYNQILFSYV